MEEKLGDYIYMGMGKLEAQESFNTEGERNE